MHLTLRKSSLVSSFLLIKNQETLRVHAKTTEERKEGCYKEREDYFECLHSKKEYARIKEVLQEKKRQEMEAAGY